VGYALYLHMPLADIVPLILTAVLASIPVALPVTFTLSAAECLQAMTDAHPFKRPNKHASLRKDRSNATGVA
jgi:hypothetical protein